jgi:hypothetical protein
MFKPTALQVVIELPAHMVRQTLALLPQLLQQGRVVCFNELVEKCLLGSVAFVVGVTNGILALRQHADRASLRCPSCLSSIDQA